MISEVKDEVSRWRGGKGLLSRESCESEKKNTVCSLLVGSSTHEIRPFPAHPGPRDTALCLRQLVCFCVGSHERRRLFEPVNEVTRSVCN
jgi:hypothetical protein